VSSTRTAAGQLLVTVSAGTSASTPANALLELRFSAAQNALIDIPQGPNGQTGPFTHTLAARPGLTQFTVRRAGAGAFTAPFVVVDDCGPWPTFVGGGPTVP
jgi:hypothetical protein